MRVSTLSALWVIVVAVFAWSQQQQVYIDVVYLKDGSIVRGIIIEQVPGQTIKVETADGSVFVFKVEQIVKLAKEKRAVEIAAPSTVEDKEEDKGRQEETKQQLMLMIRDRAFFQDDGQMQMNTLAQTLSEPDRYFLYSTNKKEDGFLGFILNLLLPSVGSWVQGDYVSALVQDAAYVLGGLAYAFAPNPIDLIGATAVAAAYIVGLITPWTFEGSWNRKLADGLGVYLVFFEQGGQTRALAAANTAWPHRSAAVSRGISLITLRY